jgi:hypothetical protein
MDSRNDSRGEEPPRGAATSERPSAVALAMACVAPLCGFNLRDADVAEDSASVMLVSRVLEPALRAAESAARAEAYEDASQIVDWYFTTYFSKSPGSKAVDELMAAIRARGSERA